MEWTRYTENVVVEEILQNVSWNFLQKNVYQVEGVWHCDLH